MPDKEKKVKLKPCPFCGYDPEISYEGDDPYFLVWAYDGYIFEWFINCSNENCPVHPGTYGHEKREKAVTAWNTRVKKESK